MPYLVTDLIPAYGMLGTLVAFAKVGKTTFALELGAAVATRPARFSIASRVKRACWRSPPNIRRSTPPGSRATSTRAGRRADVLPPPLLLDAPGLSQHRRHRQAGGYGLVLIASWQAVVAGLLTDENDNAGAVRIVEPVKARRGLRGVPWLIDAHSGKGEDQGDDADPAARCGRLAARPVPRTTRSRCATPTAPSTRNGGSVAKAALCRCASQLLKDHRETGTYVVLGNTTERSPRDDVGQSIHEMGAVSMVPQTADAIAKAAGLVPQGRPVAGGIAGKCGRP